MFNPGASSLPQRLNTKVFHIALMLGAAFLALGSFRPLADNVDLGWHVAQGRWMVEHGSIYRRDVLNYPNFGHSMVNEYPLYQVVVYGAWKLGPAGMIVLSLAIYGALFFTLLTAAWKFLPEGSALFAVTVGAMLLFFQLAFPLRPHSVTYLCVMVYGVFLLRHRAATSVQEFWPLALLQVAWTNCHSAFVLGPVMVGLFGAEMVVRRSWPEKKPAWLAVWTWGLAFLLVLLACLVNPFGWDRFYPTFYQGELESIKAYVGEMQPVGGLASTLLAGLVLVTVAAVALAIVRARGAASWSFLLLGAMLYAESLSVMKSWPVFGLFPPLVILSTGAFGAGRREAWPWLGVLLNIFVAVVFALGLRLKLTNDFPGALPTVWREYALERNELPYAAVDWMREHQIEGRLLHRCEEGGLLQERGYDHGETLGDTGFGKYDEKMIHVVSMIGDRPALLPEYTAVFHPDYVVGSNFCYRWPWYLAQSGWRLIFYSPYGQVWAQPGLRPDLPTVTGDQIDAAFAQDLKDHGRPADTLLFWRNLIALNSLGREDFAFAQLTGLPADQHKVGWYWEVARIMCFDTPRMSDAHRLQLIDEAERLPDKTLTAEFRAYAHEDKGDLDGAWRILTAVPADALSDHASDLLLKIAVAQKRPEAQDLGRRTSGVDLRNGLHWEYAAQAALQAGQTEVARRDWAKAVFFYPDDPDLMAKAEAFAAQTHDEELARAVRKGADLR